MKIFQATSITPGVEFYAGYSNGCPITIVHAKPESVPSNEKLHYHTKDTEYFLVLRGKIIVSVMDEPIEVKANTCLETLPHERHKITFVEEKTEYLVIRTNNIPGEKVVLE